MRSNSIITIKFIVSNSSKVIPDKSSFLKNIYFSLVFGPKLVKVLYLFQACRHFLKAERTAPIGVQGLGVRMYKRRFLYLSIYQIRSIYLSIDLYEK